MPILTPKDRLGTKLADKYRLDRILGKGGMGVVFEALHEWTERPVAVKLLYGDLDEDPMVIQRFLREAKTAAKLKHPNVVDVLDMGQAQDGAVYLVLELLEGEPLDALLEREGKLGAERTLELLLPVLDALRHAHSHQVVHRDIKPENIFLSVDARSSSVPKLLDFGIAKVRDNMLGKTATGTVIGTPFYMSPEQARGDPELGPASDVWSFGVVLFACLTGELPYDADSLTALIAALLMSDPKRLHGYEHVPPNLARVIDSALVRDSLERYADAGVFLVALADAANADGLTVPGLQQLLGGAFGATAERASPPERSSPSDLGAAPTQEVRGGSSAEAGGAEATGSSEHTKDAMESASTRPPRDSRSLLQVAGVVAAVVLLGALAIALSWGEGEASPGAATDDVPGREQGVSVPEPATRAARDAPPVRSPAADVGEEEEQDDRALPVGVDVPLPGVLEPAEAPLRHALRPRARPRPAATAQQEAEESEVIPIAPAPERGTNAAAIIE